MTQTILTAIRIRDPTIETLEKKLGLRTDYLPKKKHKAEATLGKWLAHTKRTIVVCSEP